MKHLLAPVVVAMLGSVLAGPALASDRDRSDRQRLVQEMDRRMDAKLKKFRRELLQDIARMLKAHQSQSKRSAPQARVFHKVVPRAQARKGAPKARVFEGRVQRSKPGARGPAGKTGAKGRVTVRIEKDGKVWEKSYDLDKAPFGFKLPDGRGQVKIFKKLEEAGKGLGEFDWDSVREQFKHLEKNPRFKGFAQKGMQEFGKRMKDFDWKALAEKFRNFDRPEDLQRFLQQMFRRFQQGGQGEFFDRRRGHQPQRHRMHRGGKDFEVEVEERVEVRPRVHKRVQARRVPTLQSLHKEKAQLERELKELRKLLEKLLKKTKSRRYGDSSDF